MKESRLVWRQSSRCGYWSTEWAIKPEVEHGKVKVAGSNEQRNQLSSSKRSLGPHQTASGQEGGWEQMGLQKKAGTWWVGGTTQGSTSRTRLLTEVRLGLWGNVQPNGSRRVRPESYCSSVHQELKLHQMDVTTAFLNGELQEEVYVQQPKGFVTVGQEQLVCKLKCSIYELKQSPQCWNHVLDNQLEEMGFKQIASDPCLYVASEGDLLFIVVYVNDLILGGKEDQRISRIKKMLARRFEVKDLGELSYFQSFKIQSQERSGSNNQPIQKDCCKSLTCRTRNLLVPPPTSTKDLWRKQKTVTL